ncbi:unnamed protein product [Rotaria sp. Silwood2]|nr:unnamed protein product [Rotaria sp. Silwood2]CAF4167870.1 unnamed protein product [Rotaria sp. Silwood2]
MKTVLFMFLIWTLLAIWCNARRIERNWEKIDRRSEQRKILSEWLEQYIAKRDCDNSCTSSRDCSCASYICDAGTCTFSFTHAICGPLGCR